MREDAKPYRAGPGKSGPRKKKAVNLTIDAELLAEAKAAGTNLSSVLETALKEQLKQPIEKTLPLKTPPLPDAEDLAEAETIDKLTLKHIFDYEYQPIETGGALIILNPSK